jgi:hypothetical protein
LQEVVRRHEVLRTAFTQRHGHPMQSVEPTVDLVLAEHDVSALPEPEREGEWHRVVREQGRKPFDLARAPLLRATMVHWSAHEHRLLLTIHHIIADEWSMELLQREIRQLYEALAHGRPSPLPALPIQYAGSGSGYKATCCSGSWHTGGRRWRARPRCWTCPPTSRGRPCRAFVVPRSSLRCRRRWWSG